MCGSASGVELDVGSGFVYIDRFEDDPCIGALLSGGGDRLGEWFGAELYDI